ncbi:MoaD/ThiS family protein [Tenacibaculum sp. SG-28]|uniref:MoaD/ThiS family protein n=1 Tax=Tenacibaculum sp. SG-28 TaxID=754426 RepID=UPI000CF4493D|nr:MoaD/ThiS family protein [Tenacibaculum sp. SG-28]PQJ21924.1 hypothetical protein BSU00_07830 [Tenacibaculum sp. SG-28]
MKIQLLAFGITKDILETSSVVLELKDKSTVKDLQDLLYERHPKFKRINAIAVAVNEVYANSATILENDDVVALIPPVSGG